MKCYRVDTWHPQAARVLAPVLGDCEPEIARQVNAGIAELWHFPAHGWLVTRCEAPADALPVLVLVAAAGRGLREVLPWLLDRARAQGVHRFRAHTEHRGVGRMLARHGFKVQEVVYSRG